MSSAAAQAQPQPGSQVPEAHVEGMQAPGQSNDKIELPGYFEDVKLDDLVVLIADLLHRMVVHNDQIPLSAEGLTRFHSRSTPGISILDYLRRIIRYVRVERSVLLLMLHSIDQICARRPSFNISSLSVHRFVIASITILSKAFCDAFSPNPLFAKVGGVSLIELNLLEREFLSAMDWRLAVRYYWLLLLLVLLPRDPITDARSSPLHDCRPGLSLAQCTREVLHTYYVKLVRTHSSGRYVVPDTSPRPAPIDTLPSNQIEWNMIGGSTDSLSSSSRKGRGLRISSDNAIADFGESGTGAGPAAEMDESGSSSDEEDPSPAMATDINHGSSRRVLSRGLSSTASPASGSGQSSQRHWTRPSSSTATLEQSVAFMEMRSMSRPSSNSNRANPPPTSPSENSADSRSPLHSFRSPTVGRRRRRSSGGANSVANAILGVDVADPGAIEGLVRGSSRRRLHLEGNNRRMEVEPGTPG
ncbi:cyclin-domain-containing protein [Serendipita vermifera]|nr:cyclin-domain-containing protein [Serendipita vermifera]